MQNDKNAEDKNFDYLNLEGINLKEKNLQNASFKGTNLKNANLSGADLSNANLIETNLDGADLSNTILTGACIENWIITSATKIGDTNTGYNIKCDYLYLRQETPGDPNRLRKPKEGNLLLKDLNKLLTPPETEFPNLYQTLAELYVIKDKDKVICEARLIKAADEAKMPLDSYRQMFQDYCRQKKDAEWKQSWWQSILATIELWIEGINYQMSQMDIFPVLDNVGKLSILVGVLFYINDNLQDKVEPKYRAWEIINTGKEEIKGGNYLALEDLAKQGKSLRNIKASGADLSNINLSNADLIGSDLSESVVKNADLSNVKLQRANLRKANLTSVQFSHKASLRKSNNSNLLKNYLPWSQKFSDLTEADLTEAKLIKADLTKANLTSAKLIKADLTDAKLITADLRGANLQDAVVNEKTDLTNACYNHATKLPSNLDPEAKNMREVNNDKEKCEKKTW
jgi:uncharacterized protein YjbI with pentapeptide repeats